VRAGVERGEAKRAVHRFTTTTRGLLELADWLRAAGCNHVAMEATGVYWKLREGNIRFGGYKSRACPHPGFTRG
jgi:hypothetical protein